jgi:NAD(P)-dependent dehydrogenase (short-subunit alcohol dehydrogenase family)
VTTALASFGQGIRAVVVGASGGIGGALTARLAGDPLVDEVIACSRKQGAIDHPKVVHQAIDLEDEASIANASEAMGDQGVDLVIVATGLLHQGEELGPEKSWRSLDADAMERVYRINTIGPALVGKHLLPKLSRGRKSVFAALSARVGSIGDNHLGGWYAYRASKAALNMIIRNFSIELARRNQLSCCIGLHPGTVDTRLSEPFQGHVPDGKLFSSDFAAERLLAVIDQATPEVSGRQLAWDGKIVPE